MNKPITLLTTIAASFVLGLAWYCNLDSTAASSGVPTYSADEVQELAKSVRAGDRQAESELLTYFLYVKHSNESLAQLARTARDAGSLALQYRLAQDSSKFYNCQSDALLAMMREAGVALQYPANAVESEVGEISKLPRCTSEVASRVAALFPVTGARPQNAGAPLK